MPAVPRRPAEMYQVSTDCFGRSPPPQHGSHASQSLRLCKVRGSLVRRAGLKDEAAKQRPNRWVDLSRQRDSMVNAIASLFAERTATFALVTLKSRRSIVRRAPMNRCAQTCLRLFQVISACERKLVLDPSDVHALFARGVLRLRQGVRTPAAPVVAPWGRIPSLTYASWAGRAAFGCDIRPVQRD
jgi:hypothetical protein